MLDELLAWLEDPQDEVSGSCRIVEVVEDGDDRALTLFCRGVHGVAHWRVRAHGVRALQLCHTPTCSGNLSLDGEHPLLLPHTAPSSTLFVRHAPRDGGRLLGDLWRAHHRLVGGWIKPDAYLNAAYGLGSEGRIGGGMGQLAQGPRPLLEAYAAVAQEHGMEPSLVGDHPAMFHDGTAWVEQTAPLFVLLVDASWIVAERFTCDHVPIQHPS